MVTLPCGQGASRQRALALSTTNTGPYSLARIRCVENEPVSAVLWMDANQVSGSECKDASDRCASWKSTGECTGTSGAFVRSMCPLSCGGCNSQRRSTHSLAEQRIAEALVATSTVQQLRQTFAPITLWGQSSGSSHSSVQLLTLAAVCLLSAWLSL